MKGIPGLVIAAVLALTGGICNWLYLANQADRYERLAFMIVQAEQIRAGDRFKEEHFTKVEIPRNNLGNLEAIAVKWSDRVTVYSQVATRDLVRDQLLLREDLKTPAQQNINELIGSDELAISVTIDPRTFNPQLVNPGDLVSFRVPRNSLPTPATGVGAADPTEQALTDEIIGPFRILALGNRKGRSEVAKAAGQSVGSETTITIAVDYPNKKMDRKAQRLLDISNLTGFKGVQPLLHPMSDKR